MYSGSDWDDEFLDAVSGVMIRRELENPTGRLSDVDTAWEEFQKYYNTPDGEGLSLFSETTSAGNSQALSSHKLVAPSNTRSIHAWTHIKKPLITVAATISLLFALMICTQAAGINLFGALAEWTDETFHFVTHSDKGSDDPILHNAIQSKINLNSVLGEYAPTWYPERFIYPEANAWENEDGVFAQVIIRDSEGDILGIALDQYKQKYDIDFTTFEMDTDTVAEYSSGEKLYYIFANLGSVSATWSDGNSTIQRIWGDLSISEIEKIINSIGG